MEDGNAIRKVLYDYEGVLWRHPAHDGILDYMGWHLFQERLRGRNVGEAINVLARGMPLIPYSTRPLKTVADRKDCRAHIMYRMFNMFVAPKITPEFLDSFVEESENYLKRDAVESICTLSDAGKEIYIGSTGSPKEVIRAHLERAGIYDRVGGIAANSIDRNTGKLSLDYLDRAGKARILYVAIGDERRRVAMIDDQPDIACYPLGAIRKAGGIAAVMNGKGIEHDFTKVDSLEEFDSMVLARESLVEMPA